MGWLRLYPRDEKENARRDNHGGEKENARRDNNGGERTMPDGTITEENRKRLARSLASRHVTSQSEGHRVGNDGGVLFWDVVPLRDQQLENRAEATLAPMHYACGVLASARIRGNPASDLTTRILYTTPRSHRLASIRTTSPSSGDVRDAL